MYHPSGSFDDKGLFTPQRFREFTVTTSNAVIARYSGVDLMYYDILSARSQRYEEFWKNEIGRLHWSTICGRFDDEAVWFGNELIATIWYGCKQEFTAPRVIVRIFDTRSLMLDSGRIWDGTDESEQVKAIEDRYDQEDERDGVPPRQRKTRRTKSKAAAAAKGGA